VRPVGANAPRSVDVRVVAATNRSLANSVNAGSFREDLYYRLAVIELALPPLRSRREDIPLLVSHFLRQLTGEDTPVSSDLLPVLLARSWPGNVRELRNFVERCCALGLHRSTSPPSPTENATPSGSGDRARALLPVDLELPLKAGREDAARRYDRLYVEGVLRQSGGNITQAAALAGVSRRFLQRLIVRRGIRSAIVEPGAADLDAEADDDDDNDHDDDDRH